jgi:hypothetical protein
VGRYSRNFGKQNRLGGMVTSRYEHGREDRAASLNMTYSADAFFRIRQALTWNTMISASTTSGTEGNGIAATSQLSYFTNQWYLYYNQSVVTRDYTPGAGFVYGRDLINTDFGGFPVIRSPKLPKPIRNWDPGFFFNMFHRASDGAFQQLEWTLFPVYLIFLNGSVFYTYIIPSWQRLDYTFRPAGRDDLQVSPGSYQYTRYEVNFTSDRSRKLAYGGTYSTGGYFDGNLNQWIGFLRYSPVPHVSLLVDYTQNRFREMARENTDLVTHLITPQVRLALNPRVQLTGFYQRNTAADRDVWNVRFSWEFQPLSFLYLVYNSNAQPLLNGVNGPDRLANEQVIGKLTYLKQF